MVSVRVAVLLGLVTLLTMLNHDVTSCVLLPRAKQSISDRDLVELLFNRLDIVHAERARESLRV